MKVIVVGGGPAGSTAAWKLREAGLDVRLDGNPANMHHKVFIIDGHIVITGSYNFSRSAEERNDENTLIIHDPAIAQAAVFGEARPFNVAVLQPTTGADVAQVDAAVSRINDSLPDYARVRHWLHADEPFTIQNGGISGTGRLKRHNVFGRYQSRIESLYMQEIAS